MGVPKYCFTPSRVKKNKWTIKLASSISARVKRCLFMFEVMPLYFQGKSISDDPETWTYIIFTKVVVNKVQILWEGQTIWKDLPPFFETFSTSKQSGIFFPIFVAFSEKLNFTDRCSLFFGPIIVKKTKMGGRVHISFTSKQIQYFLICFFDKFGPSTKELHPSHYVRPLVPANFHKHVYLPSILENIPLILLYFRKSE